MRKYCLLPVIFLLYLEADAQEDSLRWVKEINEQVWKPFTAHLISGNKEGFSNVHSKKITRVEIDRGIIKDYEKYFPSVKPEAASEQKRPERLFELRFDKRISNGTMAWETGYYQGAVIQMGKEPRYYYGRFFVVLEKENGVWKILVDADTGKDANEENFRNAFLMEAK